MMDYDLTHGRTYLYDKHKPLYAFGYGLSYTTFDYSKLSASASTMPPSGQVEVSVAVKNTGSRASDEVVQLYVQHLGSAVERPQLELVGFRRIPVAAGATAEAKLTVKARDLAYWNTEKHAWVVEKEQIKLLAGGSSDNLPVSKEIQITGEQEFKP
jgi:beta-glucosidase